MVVNFTTFSKNDPDGAISFTSTRLTFTNFYRESDAWAYYNYGAGYFTDFEHWLELYITSINSAASPSARGLFTLASDDVDNWVINNTVNQNDQIGGYIQSTGAANKFSLTLRRSHTGSSANGTSITNLDTGTLYYLKWKKVGTAHTLECYSDADRTVLVGTSALTDVGDYNYQYLMGIQSYTSGANGYQVTGYIQNYSLVPALDASKDLYTRFLLPTPDSEDLKAEFIVAQDAVDLKAEFHVGQDSADLTAEFFVIVNDSANLFAKIDINQENGSTDLFCKFAVRQIYDLSQSGGIGFFWEGVGRGMVDIQILTPTGAWIGKFPDWGEKTWVELTWDKLQEVDIDGIRPDKSQITGLLWTYHSAGERHMDGIYGLPIGGDPDLFADMIIRHSASGEIPAEFFRNHFREDLFADFKLRQSNERPPVFGTYTAIADTAGYNWGNTAYHVYGLQDPNSKKSFSAVGREWLFYCQGEIDNTENRELCFVSEKNGVWSSKTLVPGIENVYGSFTSWGAWAVYFDGTYIHLAFSDNGVTGNLQYQRGTPAADGTIAWGATTTVVTYTYVGHFDVSADVNGYPYIIYANFGGSYWSGNFFTKATTNDGAFVKEFNTEYNTSNEGQAPSTQILRFSNGNMFILRCDTSNDFDEYLWDGAVITHTKLTDLPNEGYTATVDDNDAVHVVSHDPVADSIKYRKRASDGTWTSDITLVTGITENVVYPSISAGPNGELVVFYFQDATISYIRYTPDDGWSIPESRTLPYHVFASNIHSALRFNGKVTVYAEVEVVVSKEGIIYAIPLKTFPPLELKAEFIVAQGIEDLKATFDVGQGAQDLKATFTVPVFAELYARFKVEPHKNLKAIFTVGQESADLKAVFRVRETLDVYTNVGTSGSQTITDGNTVTVNQMTRDIVCTAGDKLVVSFDATIIAGSDSNLKGIECWVEIDGVQVGGKTRFAESVSGNIHSPIALSRAYEIPSNGTYTVEIKAEVINEPLFGITYTIYQNFRTMTVQHFG